MMVLRPVFTPAAVARGAAWAAWACWLLLAAQWVAVPITAAQSGANVLLEAEQEAFNVGDRVALNLTVRHPVGHRVIAPDIVGAWGDLEVLDVVPQGIERNEDGSETTRMQIFVTAWEPRTYATPQLALEVSDAAGNLRQLSAESINLTVNSVLDPQDLALRDIKPQASIDTMTSLLRTVAISSAVAIVLLAAGLILYRRTRRHEEAIAPEEKVDLRSPNVIALEEIDAIEAHNLPEDGRFIEHYTQITDALRRYLERSYGIAAMEATTFEIRRLLRNEARLDPATRQQLITLLQSADLVKFARVKPDLKVAKLLPGRARAFVRDSHAQLAPPPVEEVSA